MGVGGNFFSKVASVDPLAQALHLPGATNYAKTEAQAANNTNAEGPYAGVMPSLAGANGGYAPGGPGANSDYTPFVAKGPSGLFGAAQRISAGVGASTPSTGNPTFNPGAIRQAYTTGNEAGGVNPYGGVAPGSPGAQAGMNPYVAAAAAANANATNAIKSTGGQTSSGLFGRGVM